MKEFKAGKNEAGQRLDKYLKKILPNASMGFIYKMLRKKNIKLQIMMFMLRTLHCLIQCLHLRMKLKTN